MLDGNTHRRQLVLARSGQGEGRHIAVGAHGLPVAGLGRTVELDNRGVSRQGGTQRSQLLVLAALLPDLPHRAEDHPWHQQEQHARHGGCHNRPAPHPRLAVSAQPSDA